MKFYPLKTLRLFRFLAKLLENLHEGSFQEYKKNLWSGFLNFCFLSYLACQRCKHPKNSHFGPFETRKDTSITHVKTKEKGEMRFYSPYPLKGLKRDESFLNFYEWNCSKLLLLLVQKLQLRYQSMNLQFEGRH